MTKLHLTQEETRLLLDMFKVYLPIITPLLTPEEADILEALYNRIKEEDNDTD